MTADDKLFQLFNEIGIIAQLSGTLFERVMPEGMTLAQFTVLTGIIVRDGTKEFWLSDKSTNKRLVRHEGEELKYADVDAKVFRIEPKFILLKKDDVTWRLDLGENLKSLRKLEPPKAADAPKVEPVKENQAT